MFKLISNFEPRGDQPEAIKKLSRGIGAGLKEQVLLGVTGSGKTFTMANVIRNANLPTLVISPNKTLAAQLYLEFKNFFPENAVHYFVSYYDYYQPEAYLAATDTYIAKDARINRDIDKLRHAALQAVLSRRDLIVVASVSCIYGVGDPEEYQRVSLELKTGQKISAADFSRNLNFLQYERTENKPEKAGQFKIEDDSFLLHLITGEKIVIQLRRGAVKKITNLSSGKNADFLKIFPAKFWVTPREKTKIALANIKRELNERVEDLQAIGKFQEAERLEKRVGLDLELLKKDGYVNGIENYSRHLSFRQAGDPPFTLLDYFPKPFLLFMDESHIGLPQLRGMHAGDRRRKQVLVDHGFRLPSALDNRPLKFEEFKEKVGQTIYVSATPAEEEMKLAKEKGQIAEQIIRPTGLLDPEFIIRPAQTQIKSLLAEIRKRTAVGERVLALTLTKRQSEDLTEFLLAQGIKAEYIHSEIKTLRRPEILRQLRGGEIDVLVGINLLREGLDLPEVGLIAILNADREGFLRNHRSLIQMAGRAARSLNGQVILYADQLTNSIKKAVAETNRRRRLQMAFNKKFHIQPLAIQKPLEENSLLETAGFNHRQNFS